MSVIGRSMPYPNIIMSPKAPGVFSISDLLLGRPERIIEKFSIIEPLYERGYIYECGSILEMIEALLYHFLRLGYKIGKCEHCHRWYAKSRLNERYCTRRSPVYDNHCCKTAVQYLNKMESEKDNEAKRVYKNLTQSYRNRINTSKSPERSIKLTIELNDFMETALKYKEAIRTKKCTPEQFIEWMNSKRVRRPRKKEK